MTSYVVHTQCRPHAEGVFTHRPPSGYPPNLTAGPNLPLSSSGQPLSWLDACAGMPGSKANISKYDGSHRLLGTWKNAQDGHWTSASRPAHFCGGINHGILLMALNRPFTRYSPAFFNLGAIEVLTGVILWCGGHSGHWMFNSNPAL